MRKFWQNIQGKLWFQIISNRYVLSLILFGIWMGFIDVNSWLIHRELNQEIDKLETSIEYYRSEIAKDQAQLQQLNSSPEALEKFAREQYFLVREGEEIFLIQTKD